MNAWGVLKIALLAILGLMVAVGLSMIIVFTLSEPQTMSGVSPDAGFELAVDGDKAKQVMKNSATNENPIVATVDKNGKVHIQSGPRPVAPPKDYNPNPRGVENWDD